MKVTVDELYGIIVRRLSEAQVPDEHAGLVAHTLVDADQRGVSSHGSARLPMYLEAIESGTIEPAALPTVEQASPATSLWNGNKGLGQVTSAVIVDHAVREAGAVGAHVAVCHNTNHFGAAAYWARRAAAAGCAAMAFTTAHPLIVPTRGTRPELGTNPIALALEGEDDEFVLDMATSTVALGKVEVAERHGSEIPDGWAIDDAGQPVNDPSAVYPDVLLGTVGGLLPLGGDTEAMGGHKGYGLANLVEILCCVLAGGDDLTPGRPLSDRTAGLWRVSHCFIVIDTEHLAGRDRTARALDQMLDSLRQSPPVDGDQPVLVHGDKERAAARAQATDVEIHDSVWEVLTA